MTVASLPALPSLIPPFVLQRVGSRVSQKLLWQTFWKIIIKRFAIHGAAAATLSAADGPLPIGEIISLGIAVSVLWEIYHLWPELWEQTATEVIEKPPTSTPSEEKKTPNPGQQPKPIPPRIPTQQDQDDNKRNYLHAFGNKTQPRPPREGRDIEVDEKGYVNSQPEPGKRWPKGASTFGDPYRAPLTGHFHRIPRNTPMPKGLAVIADGKEVGGRQGETHHTIFPVERMLFLTFSQLFLNLPWVYAGNKK
ncbi:MAG TPA: hypothetical protein VK184_08125 [Nostocaceae cyanobacterium]|nr:hypothetical protein [Nostocaceae cyanobacterium]